MDIRALRTDDDRDSLQSGDSDLDTFFRKYAGQNQFRHHIGTTYVAVEGRRILGYVTVAPGHLDAGRVPILRKGLPRYPLPVLRLARLAADAGARGRGIGRSLLRSVFALALRMADDYGCVGVIVDAKAPSVSFYGQFGFQPMDVVGGHAARKPTPLLMFLPLDLIRQACEKHVDS